MSKYFLFLEAASQDSFLAKIRQEVTPSKEDPQSDADDESGSSDPELEPETERKHSPKQPRKQNSQSLVDLIHSYEPKMKCITDTDCLLSYTVNNIDLLQVTYGRFKKTDPEDLVNEDKIANFKAQLEKLQKIIQHLYQSTSTQRGAFVTYTGVFKNLYVNPPFNETDKEGLHMTIIRNILHADKNQVIAYLKQKEERLYSRLSDKYVEEFNDISRKVNKMEHEGANPDAPKKDAIQLLLATMCAMGCRKGAVLDPNCKFYTYDDYIEKLAKKGLTQPQFRLGVWNGPTVIDEENSFAISTPAYKKEFGDFRYTIVQSGVLKDKSQSINRFLLDKSDKRFVENKVLIKPTIILPASEVVGMIKLFRKIHNITKETFVNRRKQGNKFSTRAIQPYMDSYFPQAAALSAKHNWEFGSHYCRKLYCNSAAEIYIPKLQQITSKYVDKSIFCSNILGHGGSIATSLSYANVFVKFSYEAIEFKIPPLEHLRNLVIKNEELQRQNQAFKEDILSQVRAIGIERPTPKNESLFSVEGKDVALKKIKITVGPDEAIRKAISELKAQGITHSSNHIKQMGFGRKTIQEFEKRHPGEVLPYKRKHDEIESGLDEKHVDEPLPKKATVPLVATPIPVLAAPLVATHREAKPTQPPTHPLEFGTKVIAPQNGTARANAEGARRDKIKFGTENVLLRPEDCTGTIQKDVLLAKKLTRDLCKE